MMVGEVAVWREDIESVAFTPSAHPGLCVVHLFAFRTLMGRCPTPDEALAFHKQNRAAFERAAAAKLQRKGAAGQENFHLSSRDIRRAMSRG